MTRRGLIFIGLAAPLFADDSREVWELLAQVAGALSEGNIDEFLQAFDRAMPEYRALELNVSSLLRQYDVRSSIEPLDEETKGLTHIVDLDWLLELIEQQDNTNITRRRERIHCEVVKQGKAWKVTKIEPIAFFAPPK